MSYLRRLDFCAVVEMVYQLPRLRGKSMKCQMEEQVDAALADVGVGRIQDARSEVRRVPSASA